MIPRFMIILSPVHMAHSFHRPKNLLPERGWRRRRVVAVIVRQQLSEQSLPEITKNELDWLIT